MVSGEVDWEKDSKNRKIGEERGWILRERGLLLFFKAVGSVTNVIDQNRVLYREL